MDPVDFGWKSRYGFGLWKIGKIGGLQSFCYACYNIGGRTPVGWHHMLFSGPAPGLRPKTIGFTVMKSMSMFILSDPTTRCCRIECISFALFAQCLLCSVYSLVLSAVQWLGPKARTWKIFVGNFGKFTIKFRSELGVHDRLWPHPRWFACKRLVCWKAQSNGGLMLLI